MLQLLWAFMLSVFTTGGSFFWTMVGLLDQYDILRLPSDWKVLGRAHAKHSSLGTFARTCLYVAVASFQVFFWFDFVDRESCRQYIFLFAKVPLNTPTLSFFRFVAVTYFIYVTQVFWIVTVPIVTRTILIFVFDLPRALATPNGARTFFLDIYITLSEAKDPEFDESYVQPGFR